VKIQTPSTVILALLFVIAATIGFAGDSASTSVVPPWVTLPTSTGSGPWEYHSQPLTLGSSTIIVTGAPEYLFVRAPSILSSDTVIVYGRVVPSQLVVSSASQPMVVPLAHEPRASFLHEMLQASSFMNASGTREVDQTGFSSHEPESVVSLVKRWLHGWSVTPEAWQWKWRVVSGLALASLVWSFLLSAQTSRAAASIQQFPWTSLTYGLIGSGGFVALLASGWHHPLNLIVPVLAIFPLFPVLFLAPAVTGVSVGRWCLGTCMNGRAWPWVTAVLAVGVWFLILIPVIGPFLFALMLLWGTGGLMLAGVESVRESEIHPPEVVS